MCYNSNRKKYNSQSGEFYGHQKDVQTNVTVINISNIHYEQENNGKSLNKKVIKCSFKNNCKKNK